MRPSSSKTFDDNKVNKQSLNKSLSSNFLFDKGCVAQNLLIYYIAETSLNVIHVVQPLPTVIRTLVSFHWGP